MKLPELFRTYLLSKKLLANVTAKNYASDIRKFIIWFETSFGKTFQIQDLTSDVVTLFQKARSELITFDTSDTLAAYGPLRPASIRGSKVSTRSFERYLSSLRKFATFLLDEGYISQNPFDTLITDKEQLTADKWFLKDFKDYLYIYGASNLTIKNYYADIYAFTDWAENLFKTDLNISNDYISNITSEIIDEYKHRLISVLMLSPKTVNRKLSSIRKYLEFAVSQGYIKEQLKTDNLKLKTDSGVKLEDIKEKENTEYSILNTQYSKMPPVRLFQRLLTPYVLFEDFIAGQIAQFIKHRKLSRKAAIRENQLLDPGRSISNIPKHIPWHKKLIHHARYTRPNWYKRYHTYALTHYIHLAILIIYASAVGSMLYTNLFAEPRQKAFAGAQAPKRLLSFQGRLTDNNDNPITASTDLRFAIYTSETASGAALLWQEEHYSVAPDDDGLFFLLLGSKSGIPATTFRDHDTLYLGITIGQTTELTPRQRLAAVAYAANSESLAGMLPITDPNAPQSNVVLALDSSGNLTVGGEANPTFAATGGQFKVSGKTLFLATEAGSDGDIDIIPDGLGMVDIQRPLVNNSDASGSGTLIPGALWINDKVAVIASESAVAAFLINNNTTGGDIIAASSSGTTRFTLANDGDLTLTGDTITASSLATFSTSSTLAISASTLNLGGGVAATIGTDSGDNLTITPNGIGELTLTSDYDTGVNIGSSSNTPAPLSVSGGIGANAAFIVNQTNSGGAILSASSSGATRLTLGNSGTLTLTSGITESNTGQYLCINTTSFEVGRNNTACSASSARFKENINDLNYGLTDVLNLHPITFTFKPEMNMGSDVQVGFIAEEVEKVIPELVSYDSQGRPSGVNYPNMTALLARSIQELAQKLGSTPDLVTIAGQSARDYITQIVENILNTEYSILNTGEAIVSPLASIDQIHTNIISPLASDSKIALDLRNSKLEIRNSASASESAVVASIDNSGNATFSGTLTSERASISGELAAANLSANEASIAGTLFADKIVANNIEGLEAKIATIAAGYVKPLSGDEARFVASPSATLPSDLTDTGFLTLTDQRLDTDFVDIENLSADFATFRVGLISLGPTTLTQATVLDSLSIGTSLVIGPNSIDTLSQTLEIQPLKQGAISFMAGAVRIETDGTLKVIGDAEFASDVKVEGKLSANIVSPLSDDPLVIARSEEVSTNSALLDIQGSASVSGALTSRKLNLAFAEQAFATSDIEATASGSAGTAFLKQYRNEITIKNPNVTEKSLIYITPVGNTNNKVLYIYRQVPENPNIEGLEGSFTVGVNSASTVTDIKFNWLIVN